MQCWMPCRGKSLAYFWVVSEGLPPYCDGTRRTLLRPGPIFKYQSTSVTAEFFLQMHWTRFNIENSPNSFIHHFPANKLATPSFPLAKLRNKLATPTYTQNRAGVSLFNNNLCVCIFSPFFRDMWTVCAFVLLVSVHAAVRADPIRKCGECDPAKCVPPADDCLAGLVRDLCGCCYVCGRREGELCDGDSLPIPYRFVLCYDVTYFRGFWGLRVLYGKGRYFFSFLKMGSVRGRDF